MNVQKQAWQMDRGALLAELEAAKIEQVASRRREVAAEGRSREEAARRCEAENAIQAQTEELGRLRLESLETEKRCAADREVSHGAMKQLYSQIDGQRYEIARLQARVEHLAQCADLIRADALENSSSPLRFEDLRDAQPQILSRASPPCLVSAKALVTGDSVRASSPLALQMRGGAGAATQTGGRNEFDCSQPPMQEGGGSAERERKQKTAEATLWGYAEVFGVEGALRRLAACSSPVMKSEVALPAPQDVEGAAKREGREGPLDSAREFSVERTSGLTKTHDSIAESLIHSILQ
uniref:Uncharacterized protein n=1 Tax=Chromera velia CCMP2878 TaxID=1169474 RepID=A0A0G4I4I1_9ALVE|eukprot:Cvel_35805.t1-p1 / transcript=Cvel_35805.t1 / gene=Cvel_35805 / organism=Chromera_velia_CCMP2878 / gene_product=hypothetical protein / transcript_product=hypothetical protein / location=Cvel_scaffold6711:361-1838(+) / protein_length=295 / sequence_SO=supercontig / SO=protein_coding / is_pseudo=false